MRDQDSADNAAEKPSPQAARWEHLAYLALLEYRRDQRWKRWGMVGTWSFRLLLLGLVFTLLQADQWDSTPALQNDAHIALIRLEGPIVAAENYWNKSSSEYFIELLEKGYANPDIQGIILAINSPGGSPVQSHLIYHRLRQLRSQRPDLPVHAVIADVGASGAYYVAAGAEHISASPASIVGSIGVVAGSFGMVEGMRKLGLERRLWTAGDNKASLDPFQPLEHDAVNHLQGMLNQIHGQFINAVQEGRGERLRGDPKLLFSGLVWTGERALELGLIDDLADINSIASRIGDGEIVDYSEPQNWLDYFSQLGTSQFNLLSWLH